MDLFDEFAAANATEQGYALATTICPEPPKHDPARLYNFHRSISPHSALNDLRYKLKYNPKLHLAKDEASAWVDVFFAYYKFTSILLSAEEAQNTGREAEAKWVDVYEAWKEVVNALVKGYSSGAFYAWTIPCLYVAGKYLRVFAIKADASAALQSNNGFAYGGGIQEEDAFGTGGKNEKLEDAARQINRIFGLCVSDRYVACTLHTQQPCECDLAKVGHSPYSAPLEESRKWALYYVTNLLFKTYFRLNSISLCKTVLRALAAAASDMPPLENYPKAHQVTYKYYLGVIHFLEEDYARAEEELELAYAMCTTSESKNRQLILTYLIPTKMITKHQLPSKSLLEAHPALATLLSPICSAVRTGNLKALDEALASGEAEFVKRRVYLTLERSRDVTIRNLFRKVFLVGGYMPLKEGETTPVRRTRIPIPEFAAALAVSGAEVTDGEGEIDRDEVECAIANMIYKVSFQLQSASRVTF